MASNQMLLQADSSTLDAALSDTLSAGAGSPSCAYGVKSAIGGRQAMEDTYCIQQHVLSPAPSDSMPITTSTSGGSPHGSSVLSEPDTWGLPGLPEPLSFFGVYDGHGGQGVAMHCADRMHQHFAAQLSVARFGSPAASPDSAAGMDSGMHSAVQQLQQQQDMHIGCTSSGSASDGTSSPRPVQELALPSTSCSIKAIADALHASFVLTDQELEGTEIGECAGATAVVAVLGREHIWMAHAGDSRAVIQRGGQAVPVTCDHKPDREDEAARVRAAGGRIVFTSGTHRVMGMLAMSRAIGDHFLRPYVIAEPEVTVLHRTSQDEVMVLATDGLWDVFSNKEAADLALRCIARSHSKGMSSHSSCRVAASVLTRVAQERGSRDNITVIVLDLRPASVRAPAPVAAPECMVPSSTGRRASKDSATVERKNSFSTGTFFWVKPHGPAQAATASVQAAMPPTAGGEAGVVAAPATAAVAEGAVCAATPAAAESVGVSTPLELAMVDTKLPTFFAHELPACRTYPPIARRPCWSAPAAPLAPMPSGSPLSSDASGILSPDARPAKLRRCGGSTSDAAGCRSPAVELLHLQPHQRLISTTACWGGGATAPAHQQLTA